MIELDPGHLREVRAILAAHLPGVEVWAYGSRVRGTAQRFSDLDLAVLADGELAPEVMDALRDAFSESMLPMLVDVHDWHDMSESFRGMVMQCHERVQGPQCPAETGGDNE